MNTNFDRETRKVLAIAMLTTLATGLVQWGVEELKKYVESKRKRVAEQNDE